MSDVPASLRERVSNRAGERCEYCGLSQVGQEATFHIDHIVPRAAGGPTLAENLALACVSCSLRKAARLTAPDPESGSDVPIFNPRTQRWTEHFEWLGVRVAGKTSVGRATVAALGMNRPLIVEIRSEEMIRGRHPPRHQA